MASQPIWTTHPEHAAWYSRTTKADLLDALCEMIGRYEGLRSHGVIKGRIREMARIGRERYGRTR